MNAMHVGYLGPKWDVEPRQRADVNSGSVINLPRLFFTFGILALLGIFGKPKKRAWRTFSRRRHETYLEYLVDELAYPPSAAFSTTSSWRRMLYSSDRSRSRVFRKDNDDIFGGELPVTEKVNMADPEHPYLAASPTRHTTQAPTAAKHPDGYPLLWAKQNTTTVLGCIVWACMQAAVAEVVFKERRIEDVARETGLSRGALRSEVKRTRKRILREFKRAHATDANKSNPASVPGPSYYTEGECLQEEMTAAAQEKTA